MVLVQISIHKHLLKLNELHNVLTGKYMFEHIVGRKEKNTDAESQGSCCSPLTLTLPVEKVTWLWGQIARAESCFTLLTLFSKVQNGNIALK